MSQASSVPANHRSAGDQLLFWGCFISLIATAFGFIIRAFIIDDWAVEFGLSETQKGEIFGVGLWPFAISIVLFSLIIDKIGYGKAMVFAFACHLVSAVVTITATGYWGLYVGTFIVALGNGTVEAVINPVVATMFPREKTKWLNILHAGWPGGLVLGGLILIGMQEATWQMKVGLILVPTLLYGVLLLGRHFPVSERVAAGVGYREMLQEVGILGALIVVTLMVREVGRVFALSTPVQFGIGAALVAGYGAYVRTLGRPMFVFLLLVMIPLATTELGTDNWITSLMQLEMKELALHAGWILVYTSLIMMILRFFAGPIVHQFSPLGLLAISSLVAAVGLVFLSNATGMAILAAATLYGLGKTFFWPTMLGVVAERFPRGGALTLNSIAGVGMLGVGVVGNPFLGNIQDKNIDRSLAEQHATLHAQVIGAEQQSVFGKYRALEKKNVNRITDSVALYERQREVAAELEAELDRTPAADELAARLADDDVYSRLVLVAYDNHIRPEDDRGQKSYPVMLSALQDAGLVVDEDRYTDLKAQAETLEKVTAAAKKNALTTVAVFPVIMLVCYLALILYFRTQGGYRAEVLTGHAAEDEKFTGGVEGPVE